MKYDKLVRDRIPEIIKEKGDEFKIRVADEVEYRDRLRDKLKEEVEEFLVAENHEEAADVLEVLQAICDHKDLDWAKVLLLQNQKREERGGFKDRIILEEA